MTGKQKKMYRKFATTTQLDSREHKGGHPTVLYTSKLPYRQPTSSIKDQTSIPATNKLYKHTNNQIVHYTNHHFTNQTRNKNTNCLFFRQYLSTANNVFAHFLGNVENKNTNCTFFRQFIQTTNNMDAHFLGNVENLISQRLIFVQVFATNYILVVDIFKHTSSHKKNCIKSKQTNKQVVKWPAYFLCKPIEKSTMRQVCMQKGQQKKKVAVELYGKLEKEPTKNVPIIINRKRLGWCVGQFDLKRNKWTKVGWPKWTKCDQVFGITGKRSVCICKKKTNSAFIFLAMYEMMC